MEKRCNGCDGVEFQLTRSRGARPARYEMLPDEGISTHALTWSATRRTDEPCGAQQNFNSRAHVERDTLKAAKHCRPKQFQLTRSRGARPWRTRNRKTPDLFQLTRSRGARRTLFSSYAGRNCISTHALTWSATFSLQTTKNAKGQFQLTRSRGARRRARRL